MKNVIKERAVMHKNKNGWERNFFVKLKKPFLVAEDIGELWRMSTYTQNFCLGPFEEFT